MRTNIKKWIGKILAATLIMGVIGTVLPPITVMAADEEQTVPYINKTLGDNGNGTYTLGLDVTGSAESTSSASPVNVVIVYDTSSSMTGYNVPMTYGAYGSSGYNNHFQLYKNVNGRYVALTDEENYTGTVYRANYNRWGQLTGYSEYEGQRFSASITRADAAEKTLYDFTTALFGYQDQQNPSNIQAALITFSSGSATTQPWTSTASDITNRVSNTGTSHKLSYPSGTNWESALARAYNLINSNATDNDPTYVVFITDGAPTRNSDGTGTNVQSQYTISDQYFNYYVRALNESRLLYNKTTSTGGSFYGIYAYGEETDYLASLMYYAYNGSETTEANTGETFETDGYYNASNTDELNAAISDIFSKIVDTMGVGQASIHDGTTSSVETTTGEISDLLEVDDSTFQYWLSWQVTTGPNGTYTFTMPDKYNKNGGNDITYTVSTSGGNVTLSWSESGSAKTATYSGNVQNNVLTVNWTGATDFYNYAPPTATYNDSTGAVDWNLAGLGTLLDSVTYRVTFEVYPSQTTMDLIADLDNGYVEYDDLDANIKKYLSEDHQLATNTNASLTYSDTRNDDGEQTKNYTNPDPVGVTDAEEMAVSKKWSNTLDNRDNWKTKTITLWVTRDGTERYSMTMNEANDWQGHVFISNGLMTRAADGTVSLKTTGHDYAFAESIDDTYDWQIESPTVRPMLVNNVETVLLKVDAASAPDGIKNQTADNAYAHIEGDGDYYKLTIDGQVMYYKVDNQIASLTAINHRRSYLDVVKAIEGENVPAGDEFPFTITINNNATGANPEDLNSDYWVWFSIWDTDAGAMLKDTSVASGSGLRYQLDDESVVETAPTSGFNGYFCIPSGNPISVDMKSNYSLRILNVPVGMTYTISESTTMPKDGYSFVSIEGERGYDESGEIEEPNTDWTTEPAGVANQQAQSITGTIDHVESAYKVTVTNKWNTIDVKLKKVDESGNVLDGSTFALQRYNEGTEAWEDLQTGIEPGGTTTVVDEETGEETTVDLGNPIDLGGLGVGLYKLSETQAPTNYETADDVYFQVYKDTDGSLKARMVDSSGNVLDDQSAIASETGTDGLIYTITVEDTLKTATVKVTKNVVGLEGDQSKEFAFNIAGVAASAQTTNLVGDTTAENHSVTYENVPYGTSVTVTETADSSFATTYSVNGAEAVTGTSATFTVDDDTVSNGVAEVVFTNTRSKQLLKVYKYETGNESNGLEGAIFTLTGPDGSDVSYTGLETNADGYLENDNSVYIELPVNDNNYTLTETEAPAGYNKMTENVVFTVSTTGVQATGSGYSVTSATETVDGASVTVYTIKVQNSAGVELPHTGGSGTLPYTLGGLMLIIASALMYGFRLRRRERRFN